MKITEINVKRFRSILNLILSIDNKNNFITICGANNTGKTNVLRALNLFFHPQLYNVADDSPNHKYHGSRGGKAYPEITLLIVDDKTEYEISREFGSGSEYSTKGKKRDTRGLNKLSDEESEKVINNFAFFFIPSINISFPSLINNLIDDVYDLEYEKTRFRGLKQGLKNSFDEYINGLVNILNHLAAEINPIFQEFNQNWNVGFEYTADVQKFKDLISEDIDFYLNDKSNRNIEGKGSGLQRLGYILLHSRIIQKLKKKSVLLCIDEPDAYLHQGLQKKLKEHLKTLSEKCQVILTSHSPTFIDAYKLTNVFLLDLEIGEATLYQRTGKTFYPLNTVLVDLYAYDGLTKIKEYLGIQNEGYELLDPYNLIVEGGCDKKYLSETCNYFGIPVARIIPAYGVTKIEKYIEFYDSFYEGRDFNPTILILIDNDEAGREEYRKLIKKINVNTYKSIKVKIEFVPTCFGDLPLPEDISDNKVKSNFEIEDFVYPEILVETANAIFKKRELHPIRFSQVERKISSKSFKEKGVLYNIDLIKNEKNPDSGYLINVTSEQFKSGMSGLYNLKGNKKLSSSMEDLDLKYPKVKEFLIKIMDAKGMK